MKEDYLTKVGHVIRALSKRPSDVAKRYEVTRQEVNNWRRRNKLPCNLYVIMDAELKAMGKCADPRLWGMRVQSKEIEVKKFREVKVNGPKNAVPHKRKHSAKVRPPQHSNSLAELMQLAQRNAKIQEKSRALSSTAKETAMINADDGVSRAKRGRKR